MKKILALIMCVLFIGGIFAACTKNGGADVTNASASGSVNTNSGKNGDYVVYLVTMDKMDQHWVAVNEGAKALANEIGITYKWDAPDTKDNAKQIEVLNNAVADGADVIMLAANDPTAISDAVRNAKNSGCKIIYVDSAADEAGLATLSTNNYNAGYLAGETMAKALENAGKTAGKIGVISTNTATVSTMQRESGFRDAIKANGKFTVLTTEYKNGDAAASQEAATGYIAANSDLVGLFGANEGSTVGVGNAIKDSGKDVVGIGFDKSNAIQALIDDGSLYAVMAQNPFTMGYLGLAQALAVLKGYSTGPDEIDTGVSVIKK